MDSSSCDAEDAAWHTSSETSLRDEAASMVTSASLLGAVFVIMGSFLLNQPQGKYIHASKKKLWRQGVIELYSGAYIDEIGKVWVDGKRMRYQNLPFDQSLKATGPYS